MTNFQQDWEGEQHEELRKLHRRGCIAVLLALLVLIAVVVTGCKSVQTVAVPQVRVEVVHDTVIRTDSVYNDRVHHVYEKGDTVHIIDSVFLYKFQYLDKTVEVQKTDTTTVVQEVQVPVRVRNWYDKATSWGFWLLLIAILACVAFKIAKWYLTRRA